MTDFTPYLTAVLVVIGALLLLGFRRRILLRIGVRNFLRRKGQVALAVAGLFIATSIISGTLVMGDSFRATFRELAIRGLGLVDEVAWVPGGSGTYLSQRFPGLGGAFFNESVYAGVEGRLGEMPHVEGIAPRILLPAAISDKATGYVEPAADFVAFDPIRDFDVFSVGGRPYAAADMLSGEAALNANLADRLEARVGDALKVETPFGTATVNVHIVVDDVGKGGLFVQPNLFVRLPEAQTLLDTPGQINAIFVSNSGGAADSSAFTDEAISELKPWLPAGQTIVPVKQRAIEEGETNVDFVVQIFGLLGSFTTISGVLLIMNIFIVLAEERKGEMGISRAVGMRRSHLTETFVFEGTLYAVAAGAIGTVAGLFIAAMGLFGLAPLFRAGTGVELEPVFAFEVSSLVIAFSLGFLITMIVIVLASWRVSRLNIVRAIRDIPEPLARRGTRLQWLLAAVSLSLGIVATWQAIRSQIPVLSVLGPSLLAYGAAGLIQRVVGARAAYTFAGLAVCIWAVRPWWLQGSADAWPAYVGFVAAGTLLVMSTIVVIVLNSRILLAGLTKLASGRSSLRPVVKTAVSYPLARKGRTGLTLATFALVVFIITLVSMFSTLFVGNVEQAIVDQSGGYDIVARANIPRPGANFDADFRAAPVSSKIAYYSAFNGSIAVIALPTGKLVSYPVFGVREAFAAQNAFPFFSLLPRFETSKEAWETLAADPCLAIFDGGIQDLGPVSGDRLDIVNAAGPCRTFTVAGVLRESIVTGMFVSDAVASEAFSAQAPLGFLFKASSGESPDEVNRLLERDFTAYGMDATVFRAFIEDILQVNVSFIRILESFLALGLVVGLAGLGVVTMRNVAERKNEIGTLRAIGFRRSMISKYLLIETSFVSLLGIGVGMLLGIAFAYFMLQRFPTGPETPFVVPWSDLITFAAVAYLAGLLATVPPSRGAARLPPAQALRSIE